MHQRNGRSLGRLTNIVRAAALEIARPEPTIEPSDDSQSSKPVLHVEAKEAPALRDLLVSLAGQVEELRGRRRQTIDDIVGLSVELGINLAERLLCTEIAANRQRIDRIVQQGLARVPTARNVTVRAHPDDIVLLEQQLAGHEELKSCRETLTLRSDAAASRGQVNLEAGELFAAWDTSACLEELRAALQEATFMEQ